MYILAKFCWCFYSAIGPLGTLSTFDAICEDPVYLLLTFMAEKVCAASDALVIVEKKLNCFVCHKNFTQPKCLPCLHMFCEACLEILPHQPDQDGDVVKCPVCDSPAQIPKDGISSFPDQFLLRDLRDVSQLLRKIAENQKVMCENCGNVVW